VPTHLHPSDAARRGDLQFAWKDHDAFVAHTKNRCIRSSSSARRPVRAAIQAPRCIHTDHVVLKRLAGFLRRKRSSMSNGQLLVTRGAIQRRWWRNSSARRHDHRSVDARPNSPGAKRCHTADLELLRRRYPGRERQYLLRSNYEFLARRSAFTVHASSSDGTCDLMRRDRSRSSRFRSALRLLQAIFVRVDHGIDLADPSADTPPTLLTSLIPNAFGPSDLGVTAR